jgi:antitoxin component of RelBE/YafQ-DinJ toxin-antitoxin module
MKKQEVDTKIKLSLPHDLKARATAVGDRLSLSMSATIRLAVTEFVEKYERGK